MKSKKHLKIELFLMLQRLAKKDLQMVQPWEVSKIWKIYVEKKHYFEMY